MSTFRNSLIAVVCLTLLLIFISIFQVNRILHPKPRLFAEFSNNLFPSATSRENTAISLLPVSSDSTISGVPHHKQNFVKYLEKFPWANFSLTINQNNSEGVWKYTSDLIWLLTPYLVKEPLTPINQSCISPPPQTKEQIGCKNGTASRPKKIAFLMQFGFDVDTLEIHLNELFDVVDRFFIIESTHSHSRLYRKPLIWERVKDQARFQKFLPKIVHFLVDDAQIVKIKMKMNKDFMVNFESEQLQERLLWSKFVRWNTATRFFKQTDLVGFGDCDEVASRDTINYLKHCILESDPIDVGIWFPFGAIDQAFLTDFPLYEHPFTLGDPTFWTLKSAMDLKTLAHFNLDGYPTRNRGRSAGHVLGGMHMTNYGYLPSLIIKRLTLSEGSFSYLQQVADFPKLGNHKTLEQLQKHYSEDYYKANKYRIFDLKRVKEIDEEKDKFVILPWFYSCNRLRYPAWERKPDSRLY